MYDTIFVENLARIITLISYCFLLKLVENMVMFLSLKIVSVMEMVAYWMRQMIVSSHANHRFLKVFCWKMQMIVDSWQHILFRQKWKYFCRQWMSTVSIESIFWWFWMLLQMQKLFLNVLYVKWTSYWCWREYIDQNETNMDTNECKWTSKGVLIRLFLHFGWKPNQRLCYLWWTKIHCNIKTHFRIQNGKT